MQVLLQSVVMDGDAATSFARMLATFGIFGLVVFVAIVWQILLKKESDATTNSAKVHYRRLATWCLGFMSILIVAAAVLALWRAIREPPWIRGSFAGLKRNAPDQGNKLITHSVSLVANDYFTRVSLGEHDDYELEWITPPNGSLPIEFQIHRQARMQTASDKDATDRVGTVSAVVQPIESVNCEIEVPLEANSLVYHYNSDGARCGYLRAQNQPPLLLRERKSFEIAKSNEPKSELLKWWRATAFAQDTQEPVEPKSELPTEAAALKIAALLGQPSLDEQRFGIKLLRARDADSLNTVDAITKQLVGSQARGWLHGSHPELVVHNLKLYLEGRTEEEARSAKRLAALADASYWADDYKSACEYYGRAHAASGGPDAISWKRWYSWGVALRQTDRASEAREKFAAAFAQASDPCDRAGIRASQAYTLGKMATSEAARASVLSEKLTLLEEAVTLCADHPRANNNLAWNYAVGGDREQLPRALVLVDRALKAKPGDADYLDTQATILCRLGRIDESLQAFDRAIAARSGADDTFLRRKLACRDGRPLEM